MILILVSLLYCQPQEGSELSFSPRFLLGLREEWGIEEYQIGLFTAPYTVLFRLRPNQEKDQCLVEFGMAFKKQPSLNERWRFGLAFDVDEPPQRWKQERMWDIQTGEGSDFYSWLERETGVRARCYFFLRHDLRYGLLKFWYPLAQSHQGKEWPWKIRIEDFGLYFRKGRHVDIGLLGTLDYRSDDELKTNVGLVFKRGAFRLDVGTEIIGLSWLQETGR